MKTIEERAFELYPDNPWCRHAFLRGCMFERNNSEKNLSLTWEDVKAIVIIADSMLTHTAVGCD